MSTIELTPAELAMIQSERDAEAERIQKQKDEETIERDREHQRRQGHVDHVMSLARKLEAADIDKVLTFHYSKDDDGYDTVVINFEYCGRAETVQISEHRVMNSRYRASSRGLKYRLCGTFNRYQDRHYTRPETVIEKVKEFRLSIERQKMVQENRSTLQEQSVLELERKYPNAKVIPIQGHERYGPTSPAQPDRYRVDTGYCEFAAHRDGDDIKFQVYKRVVITDSEIAAQVQKMVLGSSGS